MFATTYEMDPTPVPAMSWAVYAGRVREEWAALLKEPSAEERHYQAFLEQHPALVPGAFSTPGVGKSGHYPFPVALITQPPLRGLGNRVPDFMWIASDSGTI